MSDDNRRPKPNISRLEALQLAAQLLASSPMKDQYAQASWARNMAQGIYELATNIEEMENSRV